MTGPDGKGGSLDRLCYRFGADSFTWLGEYHSNQEVPAGGCSIGRATGSSRILFIQIDAMPRASPLGAGELSKARHCAGGELQENAEHPPEPDPDIPNPGRGLVKDDHVNRRERCDRGEECAGSAR